MSDESKYAKGPEQILSHDPSGKWQGTMTPLRLNNMYRRWNTKLHTMAWNIPPFEWEIGQGFKRYKHGTQISGSGAKVKLANHWTTADNIKGVIVEGSAMTDEMFSSFLNYYIGVERFYSAHKEDTNLGSTHNAYSDRMTGLSVYANHEYEREELYKALKWCIAASQHHKPFSAVLIYPRLKMAPYMDLLQHRNVRLIA